MQRKYGEEVNIQNVRDTAGAVFSPERKGEGSAMGSNRSASALQEENKSRLSQRSAMTGRSAVSNPAADRTILNASKASKG